jgi:hypothetical protein
MLVTQPYREGHINLTSINHPLRPLTSASLQNPYCTTGEMLFCSKTHDY